MKVASRWSGLGSAHVKYCRFGLGLPALLFGSACLEVRLGLRDYGHLLHESTSVSTLLGAAMVFTICGLGVGVALGALQSKRGRFYISVLSACAGCAVALAIAAPTVVSVAAGFAGYFGLQVGCILLSWETFR